jgi:hypothetical protein
LRSFASIRGSRQPTACCCSFSPQFLSFVSIRGSSSRRPTVCRRSLRSLRSVRLSVLFRPQTPDPRPQTPDPRPQTPDP